MIKVIVFDFDGVLADSNKLKYDAFFDLFPGNEKVKAVVSDTLKDFQSKNKTRFEALKAIFVKLGEGESKVAGLVKTYSARYDTDVREKIASQGLFPGVSDMLEALCKKYNLYINSATPELALERTIDKLEIGHFFKGVYGRPIIGMTSVPNSKELNLERIMETEKVVGDEVLFVGDGEADREAAKAYNCHFIGVANDFNGWGKQESFKTIKSVAELKI